MGIENASRFFTSHALLAFKSFDRNEAPRVRRQDDSGRKPRRLVDFYAHWRTLIRVGKCLPDPIKGGAWQARSTR